ncbi:hypothetical protein [Pseudomonas sp.]|uniref:hypothetical protein n=1 Tax=Pseudomonas sp. TaxID=306 RepID=UPI0027366D67|nr:hypothetical protein [Pseudomonas sp.]MDP2748778.1 hypothetical protein [Pseudomonas sp.]
MRKHAAKTLDKMPWIAGGLLGLLAVSLATAPPLLLLLGANAVLGGLFLATYAFSLKHPEWQWLTGMLAPICMSLTSVMLSEKLGSSAWYLLQGPLALFATFSLLALLMRPYLRKLAGIPIRRRHKKAA